MATIIGSSRHDENGKYTGGKAGDQKQKLVNGLDMSGEVSMQYLKDFVGKRAWYILRPKRADHAIAIARAMLTACNNPHIGYDQNDRLEVVRYGVDTTRDVDSDCSSNVRACVQKATGKEIPNFTTANEVDVLVASGLFDKPTVYRTGVVVYEGDVFVTQSKGHTGICVAGESRTAQTKPVVAQPTVKKGSTGTQAKYLQQDLNYVISAKLVEDGIFGAKSVEALKKWQSVAGLTADGIYGKKSYEVMKATLS